MPSSHLRHEDVSRSQDTLVDFTRQGGAGRWLLAESGERSLAEAQTEGLGTGIAWKVWGGPWLGKSEQGAAQTESGCQATHRPGSPHRLERQSSRPESVPSPPHPCPAPTRGPAPPMERVTSGLGDCWYSVYSCWFMDAGGSGLFAWIPSVLPACQNSCFYQMWYDTHSLGVQPARLTGGTLSPEMGGHLPKVAHRIGAVGAGGVLRSAGTSWRHTLVRSVGTVHLHRWQGTALYLSCLARGLDKMTSGGLFLVTDSRIGGRRAQGVGICGRSRRVATCEAASKSQGSSAGLKQRTQTEVLSPLGGLGESQCPLLATSSEQPL